jgi:phosphatidate cytidylyltransferase
VGAYLIGRSMGRHKLAPRLSPKKTWEGYLGGIASSLLCGALLAYWFGMILGPEAGFTLQRGLLVGLAMGVLPTLGDLGESLIKRQVGAKDSSHLLPGHGGFFDRIDSWLWAGVIGYYLITALFR